MFNLCYNVKIIFVITIIIFGLITIGDAGVCWLKRMGNNNKCKNPYSSNMTWEECCRGKSTGAGYTDKELNEVELFFAIAIDDGGVCRSCLDTCDNANCGPNKRCVIRKGRPKCICSPMCKSSKEITNKKLNFLELENNNKNKPKRFKLNNNINNSNNNNNKRNQRKQKLNNNNNKNNDIQAGVINLLNSSNQLKSDKIIINNSSNSSSSSISSNNVRHKNKKINRNKLHNNNNSNNKNHNSNNHHNHNNNDSNLFLINSELNMNNNKNNSNLNNLILYNKNSDKLIHKNKNRKRKHNIIIKKDDYDNNDDGDHHHNNNNVNVSHKNRLAEKIRTTYLDTEVFTEDNLKFNQLFMDKSKQGPYFNPVCGTDGRTYKTECQLKKRACRQNNNMLTVAYRGHCQTSCLFVKCSKDKHCLEDQNSVPHCVQCVRKCASENNISSSKQVCGVDGITYPSLCHLKLKGCNTGRAIAVAYRGPCVDAANCNNVKCKDRQVCLTDLITQKPRCVSCSFKCPRKRRPQTWRDWRKNAKQKLGKLREARNRTGGGEVPESAELNSSDEAIIEICGLNNFDGFPCDEEPGGLRSNDAKICGTNNNTYHSWCHMMKDSCHTKFYIDSKYSGYCRKDKTESTSTIFHNNQHPPILN